MDCKLPERQPVPEISSITDIAAAALRCDYPYVIQWWYYHPY